MWNVLLDALVREKKYWDRVSWKDVCQHPLVDFQTLHAHAHKIPMIRKHIHLHPDFPPSFFFDYTPDWNHFSKTAPIEFVVSTLENRRYQWVFRFLCENPTMTPAVLDTHFWPYLSHDVRYAVLRDSFLFRHPRFSVDDLDHEPYRLRYLAVLSRHPGFRPSWLFRIPRRRWCELDWKHLSRTMDMTFIETTWGQHPWSIPDLSHHRRLSFSFLYRHRKHKKWDWDAISSNVSLADLSAHHHRFPFRFAAVSRNLHLRAWFVRDHPLKKWDRLQLAVNPALPPREIWADPLLFPVWRWDHALRNPSMDPDTLEKMHRSFLPRLALFKNRGTRDPRYLDLLAMRIFLCFQMYRQRRHLRRSLAFLRKVHTILHDDAWDAVMAFV